MENSPSSQLLEVKCSKILLIGVTMSGSTAGSQSMLYVYGWLLEIDWRQRIKSHQEGLLVILFAVYAISKWNLLPSPGRMPCTFIWEEIISKFGIASFKGSSVMEHFKMLCNGGNCSMSGDSTLLHLCFLAFCCYVWQERNFRIFRKKRGKLGRKFLEKFCWKSEVGSAIWIRPYLQPLKLLGTSPDFVRRGRAIDSIHVSLELADLCSRPVLCGLFQAIKWVSELD